MGVSDDCEPPLKRVKVPLLQSDGLQLQLFAREAVVCTLGDSMARPLTSPENVETLGSKGVIKRTEFVKIITRALYSLGYEKSGALLEEESGFPLHSPIVKIFVQQVMSGKWDKSVDTLRRIDVLDEQTVKSASFLLLEQKFLERLKFDDVVGALCTLRNEIVPLNTNLRRINELASFIIYPSRCTVLGKDDESRSKILEKLQKLLPPDVLIPDNRLEHLVERALDMQRDGCSFHNTLDSDLSLFSDHQCGKSQVPSETMQILDAHIDEVWFLQFSYNGKYLASASKDQSVIVWEVGEDKVSLKHKLEGHTKPVPFVSWSPNDARILTCGQEEVIRCWDVSTGACTRVFEKPGIGLVSCGWFTDNRVFAGMADKSICVWDMDGRELECWKGHRTVKSSDMAITSDGKTIISTCRDNTILLFNWEIKQERFIEEDDAITSFSLSNDSKMLLVNLIYQEIHLWNIDAIPRIVSKYKGHTRTRFVIRSCFGGFEQSFVASGSEDSQVYIWHRRTGELLWVLPGHSGAVNCVSWNPTNLHMLASSSDDRTIRIWGLNRVSNTVKEHQINGGHANGITSNGV